MQPDKSLSPIEPSENKREFLDMTDIDLRTNDKFWKHCINFEKILETGKLHQYLRILSKAGILNVEYEDDHDLMQKFLGNPALQKIAEQAWADQQVLVSCKTGFNTGNISYHIREKITDFLQRKHALDNVTRHYEIQPSSLTTEDNELVNKAMCGIGTLGLSRRLVTTLVRLGATKVGQLLGLSKQELQSHYGIGEKSADEILLGLAAAGFKKPEAGRRLEKLEKKEK